MTAASLYRAAWVVPVTSPPIRDGFVSVRDGVIAEFGSIADRPVRTGLKEVDLGSVVLMPGFVNAHTHLELSHLGRGAVPGDRGFVPWIEDQLRARAERSADDVAPAIRSAIDSLTESGTSAVADVSNSLAGIPPLVSSSLHALVLHEVLGVDPEKAAVVHEQTSATRAAAASDLPDRIRVAVAAHAPHSISRELFALLMASGGVKAIHVAESRSEDQFLKNGEGEWREFLDRRVGPVSFRAPGKSPVQYLDELGVLKAGVLAVHCVRVDADDAKTLAQRGSVAVLCPRSNAYLGNGVPPLALLLGNGVALALGSDSLASCPSLDVLDDARFLAKKFPRVPSSALVHALTRGGATALGFHDLGEIREGALGKLASIAWEGDAPENPLAFIVNEAAPSRAVA